VVVVVVAVVMVKKWSELQEDEVVVGGQVGAWVCGWVIV
jgi:hypothetical protein